jgi:restriction system protein
LGLVRGGFVAIRALLRPSPYSKVSWPPTSPAQLTLDTTPREFEVFIARELKALGFSAKVTKTSRDRGADVIAQYGGIKVAIECKFYLKPVPSTAVARVAGARAFYNCDLAAVVTNSSFTAPAWELAKANNVLLLREYELETLLFLAQRARRVDT